jgi:lipid A oxidase
LPAALALAALALFPAAGRAEWTLTLRQGKAWVESGDLRVQRPGTDVTLHDVTWEDRSYQAPIYYEIGLTRWLPRHPEWGVGLDLTHAKAILDTEEAAFAAGRLAGAPIAGTVPVRTVVPALQFSHGLNFLTITGYRRWWAASRGTHSTAGVALYLGLGAGVVLPHVEAQIGGVRTDEYQLAGPAARAVAGLDVPFDEHISLVGEAILSWADVGADLTGGGSVEATMVVPQLTLGIALRD